jgi:tripartite-type tricarboxylate transporter receptor subunit TctC
VKRVNAAFIAAFATPEMRDAMAKQGNTINVSTPDFAAQFFRTEMVKYASIVKKVGLELQ